VDEQALLDRDETPLEDSETSEAKARLAELRKQVRLREIEVADAKAALKAAEGRLKAMQEDFDKYLDYWIDPGRTMPLFGQASDDMDWSGVLVEELGLPAPVAKKLQDAELRTLGELAAYSNSGKPLTDINGIGEAKAELVEQALGRFWQKSKASREANDGGQDADA
jgi:hypothetical protein